MNEIEAGKEICSLLEKKLSIFKRYLSITKKIKETFCDKQANNPGGFLSERHNCINKVEKIDLLLEKSIKAVSDRIYRISDKLKGLIDSHLKELKSIMEEVNLLDRELMVMVAQEGESIKSELIKTRQVRQAAQGYKKNMKYSPRFLDTRR